MGKKINVANIAAGLDSVQSVTDELSIISYPASIPVEQIKLHSDNKASKRDTPETIEDLADSIRMVGLLHPLTITKVSDTEYVLESGECRYKAITTHLHWSHVQCTVFERKTNADAKLALLTANLQVRSYSTEDKLELYRELEETLRELKAEGQFKGGIQKKIAEVMKIGDRQVRKYNAASKLQERKKAELSADFGETQPEITNIAKAARAVKAYEKKPTPQVVEPVESSKFEDSTIDDFIKPGSTAIASDSTCAGTEAAVIAAYMEKLVAEEIGENVG